MEMETFWFFRFRFRRAYDSANDSEFRFSLCHKVSYHSDYDSVASENQPVFPKYIYQTQLAQLITPTDTHNFCLLQFSKQWSELKRLHSLPELANERPLYLYTHFSSPVTKHSK